MILLSKRALLHIDSRIVNAKCSFWDYDYGWARSIHV